jgi:hypothetical protein
MMKRSLLAGLACSLMASAPASAQTADEDVRCLLASNLFVGSEKDPAKRQVAVLSSYFYLGRVDGRLSGPQLAAALKAQSRTITAANAGPTMTGCAKRLQGAGLAIQMLGRQLNGK